MNNQAETTIPFCELLKNFVNKYLIFTHLCDTTKQEVVLVNDIKAQFYILFSVLFNNLYKIFNMH